MKKSFIVLAVVSFIVFGTVVYGFIDGGSPKQAKGKRMDEARLQNLYQLKSLIDSHYRSNNVLPATLEEVAPEYQGGRSIILDPETNAPFEYSKKAANKYSICVVFATDTRQTAASYGQEFAHPSGYHCFDLDAESKY